jgi:hypothetical protein
MAANDQIEERVLQHLRRQWPQIVPATDFRQDLGLRDQQVLDIGEELAMELGCASSTPHSDKRRFIVESWGSREAFKKDKGSWRRQPAIMAKFRRNF